MDPNNSLIHRLRGDQLALSNKLLMIIPMQILADNAKQKKCVQSDDVMILVERCSISANTVSHTLFFFIASNFCGALSQHIHRWKQRQLTECRQNSRDAFSI